MISRARSPVTRTTMLQPQLLSSTSDGSPFGICSVRAERRPFKRHTGTPTMRSSIVFFRNRFGIL